MKKLGHKTDGLIFNRNDEEYISGTCEYLLKWKPPELNSIDFRYLTSRVHPSVACAHETNLVTIYHLQIYKISIEHGKK